MGLAFSEIGMNQETRKRLLDHCAQPSGLVLVAGPEKSGRTTTIHSVLAELGLEERKVVSVERRGWRDVPGLLRVFAAADSKRFYDSLEAALESDIDAVVLDIDDDSSVASAALHAATHDILVIASVEADSAAEGFFNFASLTASLREVTRLLHCVLGQRLVRTICPKCKRDYLPLDYELGAVDCPPKEALYETFYRGEGCGDCSGTGYAGRTGLFALLEMDEEIRLQILKRRISPEDIHTLAVQKGMVSQIEDGWKKICDGLTTVEEIARRQAKGKPKEKPNPRLQDSPDDIESHDPSDRFHGAPPLEALIENGLVKRDDFDAGRDQEPVADREKLSEKERLDRIARRWGIDRVDLEECKVTPHLLSQVPLNVCWRYGVFPVHFTDEAVWIASDDLGFFLTEDFLQDLSALLGKKALLCLAIEKQIWKAIREHYGDDSQTAEDEEDAARRFVNTALSRCVETEDVTDLHFERHADGLKVRVRIAGELYSAAPSEPHIVAAVIRRLKAMASMKPERSIVPKRGRLKLTLMDGKILHMAATVLPTYHGESIHFRIEQEKKE